MILAVDIAERALRRHLARALVVGVIPVRADGAAEGGRLHRVKRSAGVGDGAEAADVVARHIAHRVVPERGGAQRIGARHPVAGTGDRVGRAIAVGIVHEAPGRPSHLITLITVLKRVAMQLHDCL